MKRLWFCSNVALACLLVAACGDDSADAITGSAGTTSDSSTSAGGQQAAGGSGGTDVTSGGNGGSGGGVGGGTSLSFEDDVWPVLTMTRNPPLSGSNDSCSGANGCHLGGAGGLALPNPAGAYANLIGVLSNSTLCAGKLQVVASSPDESCFVVFYEQRLRDQLAWVDQAETDLVRAWVEQGAAP